MTNTVFSKIPLPAAVRNLTLSAVELYPNPVQETLNIKAGSGSYRSLAIYNIMGQVISTQAIDAAETTINVSSLVPGIYYVALKGDAGTKTIKFEKQ
jgi:hypothetical protein